MANGASQRLVGVGDVVEAVLAGAGLTGWAVPLDPFLAGDLVLEHTEFVAVVDTGPGPRSRSISARVSGTLSGSREIARSSARTSPNALGPGRV